MGLSNWIGPGHCYPGPSARLGQPVTPLSPRPCRAEPLLLHRCFPRHGTAIIFWLLRRCTNTRTGSHGGSEVATDGFGGSRSPRPCGAPRGGCSPQSKWGGGPSGRALAAAPRALQAGNGLRSASVSEIYGYRRTRPRCRRGPGGGGAGAEAAAGSHEVRLRAGAAGCAGAD